MTLAEWVGTRKVEIAKQSKAKRSEATNVSIHAWMDQLIKHDERVIYISRCCGFIKPCHHQFITTMRHFCNVFSPLFKHMIGQNREQNEAQLAIAAGFGRPNQSPILPLVHQGAY